MTITASGLYCANLRDVFKATGAVILDLDAETHKVAMFTNTLTPNFAGNGDTSFSGAPYTSNQVTGTGYTAGGVALTTTTWSDVGNAGALVWDAADASWTTSTIANARAAVIYADGQSTPVAKPVFCLVNFGTDYSTTAGTFLIQWGAGIFTLDLTP